MAHLLYRLQNGEMPSTLHPKVWWVLIGTNDHGMGCSVDTIVAGNLRIIQEIHDRHYANNQQHPSLTPIVINSLLPHGREELLSKDSPWGSLQKINQQLECYAALKPDVYFVNATDALVEYGSTGVYVNNDLFMPDHFHPSAAGSRKWLELIVETVIGLMG